MRKLVLMMMLGTALCACGPREKVVIYSPHGKEMLGDYEVLFEKEYPNVDVQWLDLPSQTVYTRIAQERANPAADVWWGGTSTIFTQAAEEGLLASYTPTWADAVPAEYKDADHRWYGTYRSPLAILFNTRKYQADQVPQHWDDLLDETWYGNIALRQPLNSGTLRTFIGAMFYRAPTTENAIQWLTGLHVNTASYPENPQNLFDHLKRNDEMISVWLLPDIVLQRDRNGYPFGFTVPDDTPVLTEGIAIVEGAPNREWAEKFYEFVTDQQSLVQQAREYAKIPARTDIDGSMLPEWLARLEIDAMEIDWKNFASQEENWMRAWEEQVLNNPDVNARRLTR